MTALAHDERMNIDEFLTWSGASDAVFYRRDEQGRWLSEPDLSGPDGQLRLAAIGMEVAMEALYRDILPSPGDSS